MGKKRINPITGKLFKQGDKREDGYFFKCYEFRSINTEGFYSEHWMNPNSYIRWRMRCIIKSSKDPKRRSTKKEFNTENNLTVDYLLEILPEDRLCPVFGFYMDWGGETTVEKDTSPSLDRIDPDIGYVVGNVRFISNKANRVKSDQKLDKLVKLGNWAKRIIDSGIDNARNYE